MTLRPFDFLIVGSPLHDPANLRRAIEPTLRGLRECGGRESGPESLSGTGPVAVLVATGGTEAEVLRLRSLRQASLPGIHFRAVCSPKTIPSKSP